MHAGIVPAPAARWSPARFTYAPPMPTAGSPAIPAAHAATPRPIAKLPALLVNQIAAGEVVERPASVVKELVENAIDAGARRITVELEQGGIELVRISDDGHGIPEAQLPLALAAHATSKISAVEDLDRIATNGFRGEALASIASVARVSIRSRSADQLAAAVIEAEGDAVKGPLPASGPVGTVVTVRTLFFNTPARRKFLKTPATEQGRCADVVRDAALAHPGVGFALSADGRRLLDVPPDQDARRRAVDILGPELESELLEVNADDPHAGSGLALWGLIGRPSLARATAQAQHVFVNGRPVRDKTVQHAVKEAYRGLIEPGRYPTAVLLLDMNATSVDVNVHPQKTEVRFRESGRVHSLVYSALRESLQRADLTPNLGSGQSWSPWNGGPRAIMPEPRPVTSSRSAAEFVEAFKRIAPPQTRIDFDALRTAMARADQAPPAALGPPPATPEVSPTAEDPPAESIASTKVLADALRVALERAESPALPVAAPAARTLQVHNSFVVTQDDQGMLIIDQHALHERVMFEKLLTRVTGRGDVVAPDGPARPLESQPLLLPVVVPASPAQVDRLPHLAPLFERIGLTAEPLGPSSVGVQAFPTFLFSRGVEPAEFLSALLERAEESGFVPSSEEALHEVLDMMACKAAIKAGDRLSDTELGELLALRERVERSSNCPHGRPTSIRMTIRELEKRFGRS